MNNHKQLFRGSASTKLFFIHLILGGIGIWNCWFLNRVETVVPREKPLGARETTNNKLQTNIRCQHWDLNPATLMGSECSHHCTTLALIIMCMQNNCYISRTRSLWMGIMFLIPKIDYRQIYLFIYLFIYLLYTYFKIYCSSAIDFPVCNYDNILF